MSIPPPITRGEVDQLLAKHGLAPSKQRGQNFLIDPNTVRKIVTDAGVTEGMRVLEIGPGLGSLTRELVRIGADVVALELDTGLAAVIDKTLPMVDIHVGDAVTANLEQIVGDQGVDVVLSNLPYNAATPIMANVLDARIAPSAYVMVQREAGERWAAGAGQPLYSGTSVKMRLRADIEIASAVPRTVFVPEPRVDSVMVRCTQTEPGGGWCAVSLAGTRNRILLTTIFEVVDLAFAAPRKTLRNNLRGRFGDTAIAEALDAVGRDPADRPATVPVADWPIVVAALINSEAKR